MSTEHRKQIIANLASALYDYATTAELANWENKRTGLQFPSLEGVDYRSCGAFRAWAIHCHDGRVCFSMDGYDHRAGHATGKVGVRIGKSSFIFPSDDSRSHHSLSLRVSNGEQIVWVTDEPSVAWEPAVELMALKFRSAKEELDETVSRYDAEKRQREDIARQQVLRAASATLATT